MLFFIFDKTLNCFIFWLLIKVIISNLKLNMAQPSKNKTTCDIFLNEVRMEDEPLLEHEEYGSLQI
jgi:hypothetical protein